MVSQLMIDSIRQYVKQKAARAYASRRVDMETFKHDLRDEITQILYDQTRRTPIVIPVVNEIGSGGSNHTDNRNQNNPANGERRDSDFEKQEMARIRGGNTAHFTARKASPQARSFNGRPKAKNAPTNQPASQSAAKTPEAISFKKTPTGPNPMRMWRE